MTQQARNRSRLTQKTSKNRQTRTERTGAYKDRIITRTGARNQLIIKLIRQGRNLVTEHNKNSPKSWHISPLPEGASSHRENNMGRGGWEHGRQLRRRTDTRERAGRQRPGGRRRREEPGKRQEGPGAGGAWQDPGHSHNGGPRWSQRREEPWRRNGRRLQGADQRRRSRWWRSPRRRRRANKPGGCRGSGGPGWSRGLWRPRQRRRSEDPQRIRSDWGPRWSWREEGAQRSRWDGATRRSQRRGVPRRWRVDTRPFSRNGYWRALSRSGHWKALSRGGHWRIWRPLLSSSPRSIISSPSATVQGAELHSALTPSTACSSWWALSPALAPGLTGWAQLPGRSSAQLLGFALAHRSQREMALRQRWARAGAPHRGEMVGWTLGLEWIWRDHPQGRRWGAIRFLPEFTPRRRRIPLEDHLRMTALCTRCSGLHHRMRRARRPGSWWCELTKGIVLYGPRAITSPAPAGGEGIPGEGGDP